MIVPVRAEPVFLVFLLPRRLPWFGHVICHSMIASRAPCDCVACAGVNYSELKEGFAALARLIEQFPRIRVRVVCLFAFTLDTRTASAQQAGH